MSWDAVGPWVVWVTVGIAVIGVFGWGVVRLDRAARVFVPRRAPSETRVVTTDDGWRLTLDVYRPPVGATPRGEAVVLCHGLGATAEGVDLEPAGSLAQVLAGQGYVVGVCRLRGRRDTSPPPGKGRHAYGFLDHARRDAPAVLQAVLEASGCARAFWVGHSMGGLVGYVLAADEPERVAGLVTIGSPANLRFDGVKRVLAAVGWVLAWVPLGAVPLERLSRLAAPLETSWFPPILGGTVARANLDRAATRALLAYGVADLPLRLGRELLGWGLARRPGNLLKDTFEASLRRLRVPLLVVAGEGDEIAPPHSVEPGAQLAASPVKEYRLVAGDGLPVAPGHVDLVAGLPAAKVVIPLVSGWMEAVSGAARPGRA